MAMKRGGFATVLLLLAGATLCAAAAWQGYGNARFGYAIDVPPGFPAIAEADNGDGGTSRSGDGRAVLAVWGAYLIDSSFVEEVDRRIGSDAADGWRVSYRSATEAGASWSGTRGDRILYARAIPLCADAAGYFRLEYFRADAKVFDSVVKRLVKSFRAAACG